MLSGEATNTNVMVIGLTQPGLKATFYRTQGNTFYHTQGNTFYRTQANTFYHTQGNTFMSIRRLLFK
jgi:hypothetical protein